MGVGQYGLDEPREFTKQQRRGARRLSRHGRRLRATRRERSHATARRARRQGQPTGYRGAYGNDKAGTFGGFDQMTAIVGGLWDSMLGEGRRFWIVATSDSHVNYADPTKPGTTSGRASIRRRTCSRARLRRRARRPARRPDLRRGRRPGTELDVVVAAGGRSAEMGGTLRVAAGEPFELNLRFRDPQTLNAHGDSPQVRRVDVIVGDVRGRSLDPQADTNETTTVLARLGAETWRQYGDVHSST